MRNQSDRDAPNASSGDQAGRVCVTESGPDRGPKMAGSAPGGLTILLVEDDAPTAYSVARLLKALGHEVVTAPDGVEAWSILQDLRAQVVITDWMMPRMDGLELCRRIRESTGRPYTYVVLLTARGGSEDRLAALAAGADDFLSKPFDSRELVARLAVAQRLLTMQEELERKNVILGELATTDELTGLKNRRRLSEELQTHFSLAARQRLPLSLIFLDVDSFKTYNDAFGHQAGDDALRGIADIIRGSTRIHDMAARYGGEEFIILLPMTGPVVARTLAERLRKSIEERDWPHCGVTASFGVATMTSKTLESRILLEEADRALYISKDRGRNCVTHYADLSDEERQAVGDRGTRLSAAIQAADRRRISPQRAGGRRGARGELRRPGRGLVAHPWTSTMPGRSATAGESPRWC